MSSREMLDRTKTRSINVDGTSVIIETAVACGVRRLVYTSTYNTVYGGKEIVNGDETMPLFPGKHCDEYSRTKTIAELMVLAANSPRVISTCSIRPAAIYGPGEARHFPRIANLVAAGVAAFSVGPPSTRVDWVHGDSLARAHLLAAAALLPDPRVGGDADAREVAASGGGVAAGQAYFISDNEPVNQTEFLLPLYRALGARAPVISVPVWLLLPGRRKGEALAVRAGWLHWLLRW